MEIVEKEIHTDCQHCNWAVSAKGKNVVEVSADKMVFICPRCGKKNIIKSQKSKE